jgi:hypothetical protein
MSSQKFELPLGASRTFEATDSDLYSTKILDQMTPVPSSLELKVGAQVMLMKNLNVADGMVNGARGVITSFDDKGRVSVLLIVEYLPGLNSASSVVTLSRCCYMDLRHGKK